MLKAINKFIIDATDEDYPPAVHILHNFISLARYRQWREELGQPNQWLYDIVLSFFSHSMGSGAWVMSLLKGEALSYYAAGNLSSDICHFHLLVYLATYWSPRDFVYRTMSNPRHPLRLLCVFVDGFDGISTLGSAVDLAVSTQPKNKLLPCLASIMLYNCGQIFQCWDARGRGEVEATFLASPTSDVTRGALLGFVYWFFGYVFQKGRHRNRALVTLCLFEPLLEVLEDMYDFDAYEQLHIPGLALLRGLRKHLALGPPQGPQKLKDDTMANRKLQE